MGDIRKRRAERGKFLIRADLYELPFDQFQRYKTVHDFTAVIRPAGGRLKVLDVGGYPGLIADFLPDDDVTVVDVVPGEFPNYVQASGAELPFEDGAFDLICSCDTLEHVPTGDRPSFIAELTRVSRDFIFLTAPFFDERTRLAEEILYSYVSRVLRTEFVTLKEHLDNGLPDFDQATEWFSDVGVTTANFPSGYLYNWLPMMVAKHHLLSRPDTAELHRKVDLFYNLNFSETDHRGPSYRRVIIGSKSGDRRPQDFCRQFRVASDGAEPAADFTKLEQFKLLTDLLDMELRRDVSELVVQFKDSLNEQVEAKKAVAERDREIADLQNIIKAQNESLDELHALVSRVRNFLPYRLYTNLFKGRN